MKAMVQKKVSKKFHKKKILSKKILGLRNLGQNFVLSKADE